MMENLEELKNDLKNNDVDRLKAQLKKGNDTRKKMW